MKKRWKRWKDEEQEVSSYWMTLRNEKILELETGSTRSHSAEKLQWKRARSCSKAVEEGTEL